jgi:polyisoprenoid-binding protein YceI
MKNKILLLSLVAGLSLGTSLTSCSNASGDKAQIADSQKVDSAVGKAIQADLNTSIVAFKGNGVGKDHPGKFKLTEGNLTVADGKLTGGKFTIDVNSMTLDQTEDFITAKLRPHLLSPDFLDVAKFPTATFEITKVDTYTPAPGDSSVVKGANQTISGNLTLKGVTKNVTFPARVEVTENGAAAEANFDIDRTLWGIVYGNDQSLKDKFISPVVNIHVLLGAK